ncbi:Semialdehyde dehydrogenase, dimerization domain family protein [Candida albicans]|uniref:Semialdehyde dehydrogenase, dimerization domain family protein n=1 Tax=Candida albicans TaxID=5476 RepID=A0A8H6F3A8_CANAX|nr:Semialdehyde dehydrogenase, dimerization domain family protein [Candida albicans]
MSVKKAGVLELQKYKDAASWKQTETLPETEQDIVVQECKPEGNFLECDVVFSGLDADVAGDIEKSFVEAEHIDVVENKVKQAVSKGGKKPGFIICISNCSTAGLVAPLKPLVEKFGPIDALTTTTLQAISGAGFSPGVSGMDILDNIVPYISGEEDKLEWETKKILGGVNAEGTEFVPIPESEMKVSAQCNRVPVIDGHTECISLRFANRPAPSVEDVKQCLREYECAASKLGCHSAPKQTIHVLDQPDRPQPRLDRDRDSGYGVSVGRIREDSLLDFKMVVLSHNTIIGAAGAGILIAEILKAKNIIRYSIEEVSIEIQ